MHTFTKEDKEKLDILWSLFWQLKGQIATILTLVYGAPPQLFPSIETMLDYFNPASFKSLIQVTGEGEQHTFWFDSTSTASTSGIAIMESHTTTQGRFIQLF